MKDTYPTELFQCTTCGANCIHKPLSHMTFNEGERELPRHCAWTGARSNWVKIA